MKRIILDLLTGDDNATFDLGCVMAAWVVAVFTGASLYALHRGQNWDPQAYGIGAASVLGAYGLMWKLQRDPVADKEPGA